ncbi:MAG: hypothetical protein CR975_01185 [Gammaproteobacteria bacterium]|nr:MAG: hypothetical protein CR975_01185 [Gammaproteobacteria bacterium]
MNRTLLLTLTLFSCVACAMPLRENPSNTVKKQQLNRLTAQKTTSAGRKILQTGRYMALTSKEIVRGSCWDYINTVYTRAGYPQAKRRYVLKGQKNKGPYAKADMIRPGDWLYYINHSYHNVPHSGIFVRWVNKQKRLASILSYGGESRRKPGRYRNYKLSHVYTIIRAKN